MAARKNATRPKHRLDPGVRPDRVRLHVDIDPASGRGFRGEVEIRLQLDAARSTLRLHAAELRVSRARLRMDDGSGRRLRAKIVAEPKLEMIALRFDEKIPAGAATLTLAFSGKLRSDLCGLYGVSVGKREYAFTQLEATDARKFFPCFDEPTMKARFEISVTTARANTVISNAPVARTEIAADHRKTVHFAATPPLSTYLIALAVGELESSRVVRAGPTAIRLWHTPGKGHLTRFGLEATRACLIRLERYFDLWYPYAKLDMVAVPDFEFGAMENAGAVFFRETLLLVDPDRATLGEKKRAAEVICHELAHMWYGDLVTMAWWDDLWLNEAFATWMAFRIVDEWKPEWKMWHDFQHGRAAAMKQDALRHTHPIYCTVNTAEEANENFDLITYEKGASVVRMLERYLGPAKFRRGVRAYIRRHRESNTVAADLWRALSQASGVDVESIARSWIEQEGYPVIEHTVVERDDGFYLQLRQDRFYQQPPKQPSTGKWAVPWVGRVGRSRSGGGQLVRHLLTRKRDRISLGKRRPRFVYGNANEGGFFRPAHGLRELEALGNALPSLAAVERMGLVDHQWALVCAGRAPIGALLDLAADLADECDPDVLAALRQPLAFIAHTLIPDAASAEDEPFRRWLQDTYGPAFAQLGWTPARNEPDDVRVRRAVLLAIVGGAAASDTLVRKATERCDAYLTNRRSLDANLTDGVVAIAARHGGKSRYRRYLSAARASDTPQEKRRFLLATADFRDPDQIDETLTMSLTDRVPTQDIIFLLGRLMANPAARERTWSFIKRRWPKLQKRMPSLFAGRLIEATPSLLTAAHRKDVAAFFRKNPVPSGDRALRQALERFDWYRGFRRGAATDLHDWLEKGPAH
ncbi:MAG: M1 family metallopeptidase [Deltaproteobacteria bacterium]|nr:M1 family metallopeptidase [Deltaproteobacteria bacterium]